MSRFRVTLVNHARHAHHDAARCQPPPMIAAAVSIVALIAILFATACGSAPRPTHPRSTDGGNGESAKVLRTVERISPSVFQQVGSGAIANPFQPAQGKPPVNRSADGKPILLYIGADYCPFCALERWPVVVALSRFGAFSNLALLQLPSVHGFPSTSTFSFHGAGYSSEYLDFQSVETADRDGRPLENMTTAQRAIFDRYDAPPYIGADQAGSIPFLSVANQYIEVGSGFSPDQMGGLTWQQIADKLNNPDDPLTQSIVANANYITVAICQVTDEQPASICASAPIPQMVSDMKAGK